MAIPQFDIQNQPFNAGLWFLVGAATCFLLTSLYTWHILPNLTIIVFFDIVGNLLVILGSVLLFDQPTATGAAVTLGGGALWFFEIVLLWRSYHSSGTMFLLFLGTVAFVACFVFLTMYSHRMSAQSVDSPAPQCLIAAGVLASLAVLATMFRTHIRTTYLIRLLGDACLAGCGYVWLYYGRNAGVAAPVYYSERKPSQEYV